MTTKENLEQRMDRIIEWVKACDMKASIILSISAFILTVLLASDYLMNGMKSVIETLYKEDYTQPDTLGILAAICFVVAVALLLFSILYCVFVVKAKPKESQTKDTQLKLDTLIHFNRISKLDYKTFKEELDAETDEIYAEDLSSQIYINAVRCSEKFKDYNIAVNLLVIAMPLAVGYIAFITFFLASITI